MADNLIWRDRLVRLTAEGEVEFSRRGRHDDFDFWPKTVEHAMPVRLRPNLGVAVYGLEIEDAQTLRLCCPGQDYLIVNGDDFGLGGAACLKAVEKKREAS